MRIEKYKIEEHKITNPYGRTHSDKYDFIAADIRNVEDILKS